MKVIECTYELKEINQEVGVICEVSKDKLGITVQDGIVYLTKVKPFGKKIMDISAYLNGQNKEDLLNKKIK